MKEDADFFRHPAACGEPPLFSVASLVVALSATISERFSSVQVIGEVHSFKVAASGHWYIELKDEREEAVLQVCFFRQRRFNQTFVPKTGDLIEVEGRLNIYAPRGSLSLNATALRPAGEGALYAKFVALKARLEADGLFDSSKKRPIPKYPRRVGIITSPSGAAIRDVVKTIALHAPNIELILYPASVQGSEAEAEIIRALRMAEERAEVECVLLVRGGGSLSDLWTFNGEELARAIARATLPVISGVGHETDITIADFVADYRAATPTAAALCVSAGWESAAERVNVLLRRLNAAKEAKLREARIVLKASADPQRAMGAFLEDLHRRFDDLTQTFASLVSAEFEQRRNRLNDLSARLGRVRPNSIENRRRFEEIVRRLQCAPIGLWKTKNWVFQHLQERIARARPDTTLERETLRACLSRLDKSLRSDFDRKRLIFDALSVRLEQKRPNLKEPCDRVLSLTSRLERSGRLQVERRSERLEAVLARLEALDVNRVLDRGFCLVRDLNGHICSGVSQLQVGKKVEMVFGDGKASANVEQILEEK